MIKGLYEKGRAGWGGGRDGLGGGLRKGLGERDKCSNNRWREGREK